jgi:hypothetical protein
MSIHWWMRRFTSGRDEAAKVIGRSVADETRLSIAIVDVVQKLDHFCKMLLHWKPMVISNTLQSRHLSPRQPINSRLLVNRAKRTQIDSLGSMNELSKSVNGTHWDDTHTLSRLTSCFVPMTGEYYAPIAPWVLDLSLFISISHFSNTLSMALLCFVAPLV